MLKIFSVTAFVIEGYVIKKMQEDGSCLFRAVADQIYGDEEMHSCVRGHCMDYIVSICFIMVSKDLISNFENSIKLPHVFHLLKI